MKFDLITDILLTLSLLLLIFSPLIFFNNRKENNKEIRKWHILFSSKWFGIPFILLPLFGDYNDLNFLNIIFKITFLIGISLFISLIANRKLLVKK